MSNLRAGTFRLLENWKIDRVNKETGEIIDSQEFCNAIVNDGLERIARLLNGNSSTYFRALAVGTGFTAVENDDTALEVEVSRATATLSYEASYKTKFVYTFTFGGDYAITEAGIFDSATVSGSTMLARTVFAAKNVSTVIDLIVTATITCSRV
jgi:hypothetical protein